LKQAAKQPVLFSAGVATLYREVRAVLEEARASAYRAVNFAMVQAYWQVGRLIVEHEQKGKSRAAYGQAVVEDLSRRLGAEFGRGFDPSNLRYMRMFFQRFPNRDAARHKSKVTVRKEAAEKVAKAGPEEFIRDPFVLELLALRSCETVPIETTTAPVISLGFMYPIIYNRPT
jgi:hypothetical protein